MHRHLAAAGLLVLIIGACGPVDPRPSPASPPPPTSTAVAPTQASTHTPRPTAEPSQVTRADCGQAVKVTKPTTSSAKPKAVFSSPEGLSVYDIAADSVATVGGSAAQHGLRPEFRTRRLVSFLRTREQPDAGHTFGQDSLYELDLETGESVELLRLPNVVHGYGWSPDGTLLAYELHAETEAEAQPISLCLFDTQRGEVRLIRSLAYWAGREPGQRDEVSVSWSPAATSLLVIDTIQQPSVYVVGVDGRALVPPRDGSFGRWLSDDTVLVWDDPQAAGNPGSWLTLSVSNGSTNAFALPATAHRPALSLDGRMIAFDDGDGAEPSVYVFDVQTETSRKLGRRLLGPVWLGADRIAATAVGPCPADNFCVVPWSTLGRTVGIDVLTGDQRPLQLPTSVQDQFIYGAIDISIDIPAR